jgi:pSer/pThr/pTyr-binding forkhead associated (FHA) protein
MTGFFLIKGEDPQSGERIPLATRTLVGRSDECDLKITEGHPSRRHAMLSVDDRGLWVEDLGSANGTRVNGAAITGRTLLGNGDTVSFDLATFVVNGPPPANDDATVIRPMPPASEATVVRPAPTPQSAAGPTASVAAGPAQSVPRSWADPEYRGEGTRILSAEEMRALVEGRGGAPTPGEAPAPMHVEGPHLVILAGPSAGTALPLAGDRTEWSIGTAPERDVRLDFPGVSAFHAKLSQEEGRWRIIDQMSANGTWVNGQRSTISYLQNGDKLRFAQVECEIRLPAAGPARRKTRPADTGASRLRAVLIAVAVAIVTGLALWAAATFL